ncbi:class II fructose-bisphosphate aldolase [Aquiflexum sp. LQ15W]|uniref:class II fructose-bisphosphate aldolase n=1 Tax=Cognataquiflexum nitidum TaxID=2922272 RepID=UPI001F1388FA|nr:class II fructose-bisphosphate aldolase [Cognataquiflexum nitidum]MCH6198910.1 class II fructose-bisphosphate aldolase [Cognataquiflexum nitidum]
MKLSTKVLFQECYGKYALPAVNVFTLEQVMAVFHAADKEDSPVIIQTTPVARDYSHPKVLLEMIESAGKIYPNVVYAIHLDHGIESHIYDALESGKYTSVMIDASHDDFETNINRTHKVVLAAHQKGIPVEAELGVLSGVEDDEKVEGDKARFTNPKEVVEFVNSTGCDSLAIAVGTSHGAYKFTGDQGINFEILAEIQKRLPGFPLVLHGGSSVNPLEINTINKFGGELETGCRGVSDSELQRAIAYGVCKVNIATDLRVLWTRIHRSFFHLQPKEFDPLIPGREYQKQASEMLSEKFELLGASQKGKQIRELIYTSEYN